LTDAFLSCTAGGSFNERLSEGSSTSKHCGDSVARVSIQTRGSTEEAAFGSPENEEDARDNPVIVNIGDGNPMQQQSDVVSDLADAIDQLLDIVQQA